jgi:hypothetical protein
VISEIPIDSVDADSRQTVSLDGSTYLLDLSWSTRSESWYLDLYLQTEVGDPSPIVTGVRLSVGYPLLIGLPLSGRPPGQLFALDLNGAGPPNRDDLGTRVKLYYFDVESLGG